MPLLGAHMSITGGLHKAVERAADLKMDCVQVFTKSNRQWAMQVPGSKPNKLQTSAQTMPTDAQVTQFQQALADKQIKQPLVHNSYLINMAANDGVIRQRSIDEMVLEIELAAAYGIPNVVAHPGSHLGAGEDAGLQAIAQALDDVLSRTAQHPTKVALEVTAGQGTNLGYRFEHLAKICELTGQSDRLAICLDTCHLFAAGYPLWPEADYQATIAEFASTLGFDRLVAIHINDSEGGLGSRLDRHAHIGHGKIGREAFALMLHDKRFANLPFYLETPKEDDPNTGKPWDELNIQMLRELAA